MSNKEGIDLVKMAIIVLLVVLVLGTVIFVVFKYNDYTNNVVKNLEDSVKSSKMERLYELQDLSDSKSDNPPLCTAVASVLSEFDETDLLYIAVNSPNVVDPTYPPELKVFTYEGVVLKDVDSTKVHVSSSPTSHAHKHLLQHSDKRCTVRVDEIENLATSNFSSDSKMIAIVVDIQ